MAGEANYTLKLTLTEAATLRGLVRDRMATVATRIQKTRGDDELAKTEYQTLEGLSRRFG
jgi:hypothetical protein